MKLPKVLKNALSLFSAQIYNKFVGGLFSLFAARILGLKDFGTYTLAMTFIAFFYIFSDWGISTLTIRNVARKPKEANSYLANTIILRTFLSVISYFLLIFTIFILNYEKKIIVLLSIAGLPIFSNNILASFNSIYSAHEKMHIPSFLGMFFTTLSLILSIIALYLKHSLIILMLIIVFLSIANTLSTLWLIKRYLPPLRLSFSPDSSRKILMSAAPYAVLSILSIVYFRVDAIILSKLKTLESVGMYNASYKIVEFLIFISASLMGAYFPKMSRQAINNIRDLRVSYLNATKILLIFILPIALVITFFSNDIMAILFGRSFYPAGASLRILIWGVVIMYINAPIGNILYNSDKLLRFIPYAALNTLLNIFLNLILIPRFDYIGASITTLVTEITSFIIQVFFFRKILFLK